MTIDRRRLLGAGLAIGAALAGPMAIWGCVSEGEAGEATERQRAILAVVSDLAIPRTDTPSASDVGVPAFVEVALKHELGGGNIAMLAAIETLLDAQADGDFMRAKPPCRRTAAAAVDAAAFTAGGEASPWHRIKDLIVIGYYTSEVGASKELQYELVPGRWDPDLPITANNRAWSSDWTARDFG